MKKSRKENKTIDKINFDILCNSGCELYFLELFYDDLVKIYNDDEKTELDKYIDNLKEGIKLDGDIEKEFYIINIFEKEKYVIDVIKYDLWKKDITKKNKQFDFSIGDTVECYYVPFSQKEIDYYNKQEFSGKVFFSYKNNFFMFKIDNKELILKSFEREGCDFFGRNKSYFGYVDIKKN